MAETQNDNSPCSPEVEILKSRIADEQASLRRIDQHIARLGKDFEQEWKALEQDVKKLRNSIASRQRSRFRSSSGTERMEEELRILQDRQTEIKQSHDATIDDLKEERKTFKHEIARLSEILAQAESQWRNVFHEFNRQKLARLEIEKMKATEEAARSAAQDVLTRAQAKESRANANAIVSEARRKEVSQKSQDASLNFGVEAMGVTAGVGVSGSAAATLLRATVPLLGLAVGGALAYKAMTVAGHQLDASRQIEGPAPQKLIEDGKKR